MFPCRAFGGPCDDISPFFGSSSHDVDDVVGFGTDDASGEMSSISTTENSDLKLSENGIRKLLVFF